MRCVGFLVLLVLVAGCDSPAPGVSRLASARLTVGGMEFGVHWSAERAEAYRLTRQWRPDRAAVFARAKVAIERASGCPVRKGSLGGDVAIVTAALDCRGRPPRPPGVEIRVEPGDCYKSGSYRIDGLDQDVTELECDVTVRSSRR